VRTSSGSVPGKTRLFIVKVLKSSITVGSGVAVPGLMNHSLRKIAKSRSTRRTLASRGWMMKKPCMPRAICVISSKWGWYMSEPVCRSVNSYANVSPGRIFG
jgi:hypothetical protein